MRIRIWPYLPQWGSVLDIAVLLDQPRGAAYQRLALNGLTEEQFIAVPEGGDTPRAGTMSLECAQELMDALWACGLRPSEGHGSAGAMAAAQEHLKDMRQYAGQMYDLVRQLLRIGNSGAGRN